MKSQWVLIQSVKSDHSPLDEERYILMASEKECQTNLKSLMTRFMAEFADGDLFTFQKYNLGFSVTYKHNVAPYQTVTVSFRIATISEDDKFIYDRIIGLVGEVM